MTERATELKDGLATYLLLDPRRPANGETLLEVANVLYNSPAFNDRFAAANCLIEYSMKEDTSDKDREQNVAKIQKLIDFAGTENAQPFTINQKIVLLSQLPLVTNGMKPSVTPAVQSSIRTQLGALDKPLHSRISREHLVAKNTACNLLIAYALNETGEGVIAAHGLLRQSPYASRYLAEKKYGWDVTVCSDGQNLPRGAYWLRIKSENTDRSNYGESVIHSSIRDALSVESHNYRHITELTAQAAAFEPSTQRPLNPMFNDVRDKLLNVLAAHGPSAEI